MAVKLVWQYASWQIYRNLLKKGSDGWGTTTSDSGARQSKSEPTRPVHNPGVQAVTCGTITANTRRRPKADSKLG